MAIRAMQGVADARRATCWARVQKVIRQLWRGVRDWCGDSAYDRYLSAKERRGSNLDILLTREQFYVEQLQVRYSRPNRCC